MTVNTTLVWTLRDSVSATAKKLNNNLDAVGVRAKGATGMLGKLGVATGGLVTPTSLAAAGALAFVGVMANATQAAIAEEANIRKLDAALQANVPAWDGNIKAIEKVISARELLAFSDDELRDSLAQLVAATHDVNQAQRIQATAMDLARLKSISLHDATEALVKVEGGSYRILKSLGIELKKGATQTEALAAVQKVAAGQAEAYAKTTEGKLLTAQIKLDDAMENLGRVTMPMVSAAATDLSIVFSLMAGEELTATQRTVDLKNAQADLVGIASVLTFGTLEPLAQALRDQARAQEEANVKTSQSGRHLNDAQQAAKKVATEFGHMSAAAKRATRLTATSVTTMVDSLVGDAERAIGAAFDPIIEAYRQLELNSAEATAQVAADTGTRTAAETAALAQARKDSALHLLEMTKAGQTTSTAYAKGLADLKANVKASSGAARRALQDVLDKILAVKRAGKLIAINFAFGSGPGGAIPVGLLASGGPAAANTPYVVGEEGPELFVPSSSGYVIPNGGGGPSGVSSGGGGGITVNFNSVWPPTREQARDIARIVGEEQFREWQRAAPTSGRV